MNITREEAFELLDNAKANKDFELANIYFEYVIWLDKKQAQA